jgi:hypothetical protein
LNESIPHYSATEIKIATLCPRQFVINRKYGKRVFRGAGAGIGSQIHRILALFAKTALESTKFHQRLVESTTITELNAVFYEGIRGIFLQEISRHNLKRWTSDQLEKLANSLEILAKEMTEKYVSLRLQSDAVAALKKLFLGIEADFIYVFTISEGSISKSVEVAGRIDWWSFDASTKSFVLWDFKTSSVEHLERDIPQIAIYGIALQEKFAVATEVALMYITPTGIETRRIPSAMLDTFRPQLMKNLLNMGLWLEDTSEVPYTSYPDACAECIVSSFCVEKFGTNPNLQQLGIYDASSPALKTLTPEISLDLNPISADVNQSDFKLVPKASVLDELKNEAEAKSLALVSSASPTTRLVEKPANIGNSMITAKQALINPLVLLKHAVILGASGSGKTVLGKVIIEEMLSLGYSALLIDPQGDLCSLALPETQSGKELVSKNKIKIYTPNSDKGIKMTVDLLAVPPREVMTNSESFSVFLDATSTQLLEIMGYNLRRLPPEKSILETILKEDWLAGRQHTLKTLSERLIETTSVYSIHDGAPVQVESILSLKKLKALGQNLMKIAIGVDGGFFTGGTAINFDELANGSSHLSIINLMSVGADPVKRQLVISWILRSVYDWLLRNPQREQDRIRFFLYFDEIAGMVPPHPANPPSKQMLMLLLKQARKYGCSCLLATQSPADIDYKAIDNVATFFIGRIATPQSLAKVEALLGSRGLTAALPTKKLPQVKAGEFLRIGAGSSEPEFIQVRQLRTPHQTLSLDDVEKIVKMDQN